MGVIHWRTLAGKITCGKFRYDHVTTAYITKTCFMFTVSSPTRWEAIQYYTICWLDKAVIIWHGTRIPHWNVMLKLARWYSQWEWHWWRSSGRMASNSKLHCTHQPWLSKSQALASRLRTLHTRKEKLNKACCLAQVLQVHLEEPLKDCSCGLLFPVSQQCCIPVVYISPNIVCWLWGTVSLFALSLC